MPRHRSTTLRAVTAVLVLMTPALAFGFGLERSRSGLFEVTSYNGSKIYKHNSAFNQTETDSYSTATGMIWRPVYTASARYYLQGNAIKQMKGTSDSIETFVNFTPPAGLGPRYLSACGTKICVVFDDLCQGSFKIGAFAANTPVVWGPSYFHPGACIRDATADSNNQMLLMEQMSFSDPRHPRAVSVWNVDATATIHGGVDVGPMTNVAQALTVNSGDPTIGYILDTDYFSIILRRISLINGTLVSTFQAPIGGHDITYYNGHVVVLRYNTNASPQTYDLDFFSSNLQFWENSRGFIGGD